MSIELIIGILAALLVLLVVVLLLTNKKSVASNRARKIGENVEASFQKADTDIRSSVRESLKDIENVERKRRKHILSLAGRMEQAGLSHIKPNTYIMGSAGLAILSGIIGFSIKGVWWMGVMAAFVIGVGIPFWFLGFLKRRRQKKFLVAFSAAIEMIARGVKSGIPLEDSMRSIAKEADEPVRSEFKLLMENEAVGVSMDESLLKMYERTSLLEVNLFATILYIQKKTGGNLAEALENLSNVMRGRMLMEEKMQVLSADAKNSANIASVMPICVAFMVNFMSPGFFDDLFHKTSGKIILIVCGVMIILGNIVIRKMAKVKF